jgi:hypothetical protein
MNTSVTSTANTGEAGRQGSPVRLRWAVAVAVALLFSALARRGVLAAAPAGQQGSAAQYAAHASRELDTPAFTDSPLAERQARALNIARQKHLVADADRLLKLAQELNAEITAGNQSELTPIQYRKLAEIEKLAHNVREKMSNAASGAPSARDPFSPFAP